MAAQKTESTSADLKEVVIVALRMRGSFPVDHDQE